MGFCHFLPPKTKLHNSTFITYSCALPLPTRLSDWAPRVASSFVDDVDFAQLVKIYGREPGGERRYSPPTCIGAVPNAVYGDPETSSKYLSGKWITSRE
jgi:hypothetical protein